MADLFGAVGAPRWNDPDEDRLRYRQLGHQSGQLFAQGFMSAYDQAREEKYKEEQIQKVKDEIAPVVEIVKQAKTWEDLNRIKLQNPAPWLNPRTAPILNQFDKNFELAEQIKLRAENSLESKNALTTMQEFEAERSILPTGPAGSQSDYAGRMDALRGNIFYTDAFGRVRPTSQALAIVNDYRMNVRKLPPIGAAKGEYTVTAKERQIEGQADLQKQRSQDNLDLAIFNWQKKDQAQIRDLEAKGDWQKAAQIWRDGFEQMKQGFQKEYLDLQGEQKTKLLKQAYDQSSALQQQRIAGQQKAKTPGTVALRVQSAKKAYDSALVELNRYPNNADTIRRAGDAESELVFWTNLQSKGYTEVPKFMPDGTIEPPPAQQHTTPTSSGAVGSDIFNQFQRWQNGR